MGALAARQGHFNTHVRGTLTLVCAGRPCGTYCVACGAHEGAAASRLVRADGAAEGGQ